MPWTFAGVNASWAIPKLYRTSKLSTPLSIGSCAVFLNLLGQLHFYNEKLIPKSKENENRQRFFWMLTNLAIILEMIWGDELWTTVQSCNLSIFSRIQIRQRHSVITIFLQIYKEFSKITPSRSLLKINLGQEGLDWQGTSLYNGIS